MHTARKKTNVKTQGNVYKGKDIYEKEYHYRNRNVIDDCVSRYGLLYMEREFRQEGI